MSPWKNPRFYIGDGPTQRVEQRSRPTTENNLTSLLPVRVGRDPFGRVFIDVCVDDLKHFTTPPPPGDERRGCRVYVDDLFEHLVGKRGIIWINVDFENLK